MSVILEENSKGETTVKNSLLEAYKTVRSYSEQLCAPLQTEDYVVQPIGDVSPPKWHLAHVTWFFETLVLKPYYEGYQPFNEEYGFLFNSYYEHFGERILRTDRGNLSRPSVHEIMDYRHYVDEKMGILLESRELSANCRSTLILGLNHEQQHQELLLSDIKYILGNNPLFPAYNYHTEQEVISSVAPLHHIAVQAGLYEAGYNGSGFCYDNELQRHKIYLEDFQIADRLVTNGEFLEFIEAGGYQDFHYWHSDGWAWINTNNIKAPLYWHQIKGKWHYYTLAGLKSLNLREAVCHISYFEAAAYANWKGERLPTEFEWEAAQEQFPWGWRWEWTESAYLPYPGFQKAAGAAGEYNGKFMVNQKVLRGASIATPKGHSRPTYRNFFQPEKRWQFTGIRLAK